MTDRRRHEPEDRWSNRLHDPEPDGLEKFIAVELEKLRNRDPSSLFARRRPPEPLCLPKDLYDRFKETIEEIERDRS